VSGAGLQALFGAPEAHEDDPERAVRAGLSSLRATADLGAYALRIGVESGPAIVGPVHSAVGFHYRAIGAVGWAAAALQSAARAGSMLIGPATRATTEGIFELGTTEEVGLEGGGKPLVGAYVEGLKPRAPSRQPKFGGRGRLAGRAVELSSLTEALKETEGGSGSVVTLVGEPGLGKTRLVQECRKRFMAWVGARSGRLPLWLEGRCASYASTTPYGLYQHLLGSLAGVTPGQEEAVVGPALERALMAAMGNSELWPLLARIMNLPGGAATSGMDPYDLQRATFSALQAIVARLARAGPTVLALEDLHWADATSLRLTGEIAPLALKGPLLLLLTRRPRPDPGVSELEQGLEAALGAKFQRLELEPLSEEAERDLTANLVGTGATAPVIDAVRAGADGNPMFLEERLSSMLETGRLAHEDGEWRLAGGPSAEVPQVLERLVRSRVDCLSPGAQEVMRSASVLGVEFGQALLAKVCGFGEQLGSYVSEICKAGLLQELAGTPDAAYRFRHALIQEAIYRGLLRAERCRLHSRAGWVLESVSAGRLPEVGAVLGRHFAAAGELDRAVHHFEAAGDYASAVYANEEAISSFRSALALLGTQGRRKAAGSAINLYGKLDHVLWRRGRYDEIRDALEGALAACNGDGIQAAKILMRLGRNDLGFNRTEAAATAFDRVEKLLDEHVSDGDQDLTEVWLELMVEGRALLYVVRHDPERAFAVLTSARRVLDRGGPSVHRTFYLLMTLQRVISNRWRVDDEDLATLRLASAAAAEEADERELGWLALYTGWLLLWHDDLARAQEELERCLAIGERHGDLGLQAWSLTRLSTAALRRHDVEAVRALAPKAVAACVEYAHPELVVGAKACLAWLAWQEQRYDDVLSLVADVDKLYEALQGWAEPMSATAAFWGTLEFKWVFLWPVLAVHLKAGAVDGAVAAGRQMLDPSQQRLPGNLEILLASACRAWEQGDARTAGVKLRRALGLAHKLDYF
jgi:tetratricopeptide (TPR) repeat protein